MLTDGKKIPLIALIAFVLSLGAFYLVKDNSPNKSQDAPPSFNVDFGPSNLSGSLQACRLPGHDFTEEYVNSWSRPSGTDLEDRYEIKKFSVHIYHADTDMTVAKIISSIEPQAGNSVMIAYYDPRNPAKKFGIYPPLNHPETFDISDPNRQVIPRNEGFAIISCRDTYGWNLKPETVEGFGGSPLAQDAGSRNQAVYDSWILLAASDGLNLGSNIVRAYPQKGPGFDFPEAIDVNDPNGYTFGQYKMIWVKTAPAPEREPEQAPDPEEPQVVDDRVCPHPLKIDPETGRCQIPVPDEAPAKDSNPDDCSGSTYLSNPKCAEASNKEEARKLLKAPDFEIDSNGLNIELVDVYDQSSQTAGRKAVDADTWCVNYGDETWDCQEAQAVESGYKFKHTYSSYGNYTIKLSVGRSYSEVDERSKDIQIKPNNSANADSVYSNQLNSEEVPDSQPGIRDSVVNNNKTTTKTITPNNSGVTTVQENAQLQDKINPDQYEFFDKNVLDQIKSGSSEPSFDGSKFVPEPEAILDFEDAGYQSPTTRPVIQQYF